MESLSGEICLPHTSGFIGGCMVPRFLVEPNTVPSTARCVSCILSARPGKFATLLGSFSLLGRFLKKVSRALQCAFREGFRHAGTDFHGARGNCPNRAA